MDKITKVITKNELVKAFRALGVKEGMTIEVHSSLKDFGFIVGYSQTVVDALIEAVGYQGTIIMPLQSLENNEPAYWQNPPIDLSLYQTIRDNTPAFDPISSDSELMGRVVNNFRRRPGVYFTRHPSVAFCAYGKYAKLICAKHPLDFSLGSNSPLGTLYKLDAKILLLGSDYSHCTGMHLGEALSESPPVIIQGGAIDNGFGSQWVKYLDYDYDSSIFPKIGERMENDGLVAIGKVNEATLRLFDFNKAIDYTKDYLTSSSISLE